MRIEACNNVLPRQISHSNLNFRGNLRVAYDQYGKIKYRSVTSFFRDDLNWLQLADFLNETYPNNDKVNLYDYACSSGEEAYTTAISLIERLGMEKASKFFPIFAKDIDEYNIKTASFGKAFIMPWEYKLINRMTEDNVNKYFDIKWLADSPVSAVCEAKEVLTSNIKFSMADILKDIKTLPKTTSVIFARNMWRYITKENQDNLMENIYDKLNGTNSLLVLGEFDFPQYANKNLYNHIQTRENPVFNGDHGTVVLYNLKKFDIKPTKLKNVFKI